MSEVTANQKEQLVDKDWNWHPDLPLDKATPFSWPPSPQGIWRWFSSSWFSLTTLVLWVGLALFTWTFMMPDLASMQSFELGWILQIHFKNLLVTCLFAGGLHWYLYSKKGQGKKRKFTHQDMAKDKPMFTFSDQVKDNMFWTLASGGTFWSLYEIVYFWAAANGYAPFITFSDNPIWFVIWFPLISLWSSMHFYWIHRFLHWPPMFKLAHSLHHRNINVGPWSGISMHPLEHFLYFNSVVIHFVVASHPLHVLYHFYLQGLNPIASHSGFESLFVKDKRQMALGDFFHQLHHRYFDCNYGTSEMPWDKWFGSYHDGTEESTKRIRKAMIDKHRAAKA